MSASSLLGKTVLILLVLTETKLKGSGEESFFNSSVIIVGGHKIERAKESVAVLLNDVCHSVVIDFGCVSFGLSSNF